MESSNSILENGYEYTVEESSPVDILENGQDYSVKELFSTNHRKIIIPDFQRDYCWGDDNHGENHNTDIVSGFIQTLIEEKENGDILLGKIDVYQNPTDHIHLTDGQQRLTTIYLLVGMLARKALDETKEELKRCLISNYELKDDKEPYLQYSIRESTLFFLRDLVNEFFINKNDLSVKDIENQSWYFKEYNFDPTIQSMLKALIIIEKEIKYLDIDAFSSFVINNIKIQYYDVVDRKNGEERFVIINTTGRHLSVSESIKPILLGEITDDSFSKKWEKRETFFWENRNKDKNELTSDKGAEDFMTWCFQIIEKQDSIDLVKISKAILKQHGIDKNKSVLNRIDTLFASLEKLLLLLNNEYIQQQFKYISNKEIKNCIDLRLLSNEAKSNVLLPLLYFIEKGVATGENEIVQFLRRLRKNFFDNQIKERNSNYVDWRYILQIIEKSSTLDECLSFSSDFVSIVNIKPATSKWFNTEEQLKATLNDCKKSIEKMEDHTDFMGDLSFLFNVLKLKGAIKNDHEELKKGFDSINFDEVDFKNLKNTKIEQLETIYNNYKAVKQSDLLPVLKIRFGRNEHPYVGTWSFSRENFEYKRWHENGKNDLYQNWFYFLMTNLTESNEEPEVFLKRYIRSILYQIDKPFFESNLLVTNELDFIKIKNLLKTKSEDSSYDFYFWHGFVWRCLLYVNEPETKIGSEIVFDIFDREHNEFKFSLGNQFVWTKEYGGRDIVTHDKFENVNWKDWKVNQGKSEIELFIKNRENKIEELINIIFGWS